MPPTPLSDSDLTSLLLSEARTASKNYSTQGLAAYLPNPRRATPKIKPNTRFLQNLVRNADGHNERLRKREEGERKEKLRVLEREAMKREGRLVEFSDDEADRRQANGERGEGEEGEDGERRRKRRKANDNDDDEEGRRRWHKSSKQTRGRDERRRRKRRRNTSSAEEGSEGSRSRSRSRESRHHRKHRSRRDDSADGSEEEHKHKHKSRSHRKEKRRRDTNSASEDNPSPHPKPDTHQDPKPQHIKLSTTTNPSNTNPTNPQAATPQNTNTTNNPTQDNDDDWSLSLTSLRARANHARIQAAKSITAAAHSGSRDSSDLHSPNGIDLKWSKKGEEREWDRGKGVEVEVDEDS
jgi:hypothetical protein